MKPVVLDTNIYISAIFFGGKPKEIINLGRERKIKIISSEYILWEIKEVLSRKFDVPQSQLNSIERDILSITTLISVTSTLDILSKDPSDNAILACAVDSRAIALITGDKYLLSIEQHEKIPIIGPNKFLFDLKKGRI